MKILTICRAGIVRSGGLSRLLKERFGYWDTLQAGVETNSQETLDMLYKWADRILVTCEDYMPLEGAINKRVPIEYAYKTKLFPIGQDVFGNAYSPELGDKIINIMKDFVI